MPYGWLTRGQVVDHIVIESGASAKLLDLPQHPNRNRAPSTKELPYGHSLLTRQA